MPADLHLKGAVEPLKVTHRFTTIINYLEKAIDEGKRFVKLETETGRVAIPHDSVAKIVDTGKAEEGDSPE